MAENISEIGCKENQRFSRWSNLCSSQFGLVAFHRNQYILPNKIRVQGVETWKWPHEPKWRMVDFLSQSILREKDQREREWKRGLHTQRTWCCTCKHTQRTWYCTAGQCYQLFMTWPCSVKNKHRKLWHLFFKTRITRMTRKRLCTIKTISDWRIKGTEPKINFEQYARIQWKIEALGCHLCLG